MRNLIRFIDSNSFFFLFLSFEVLAFYLLFSNHSFHQSALTNSTNALTGQIFEQYSSWTDYLNLKEVNQALAKENNRLRAKQINAFKPLFGKNVYLNDTLYERQYHFTRAKVIKNSINKQNNYLTLNLGSLNGIESGMGVLGPNGVVGVVKNVSKRYASVVSVLHSRSKISCRLKKTNYFGSLQWDGKSPREGILVDIPNHVEIEIGDSVVTSGYSATFPEEVLLGTISSIDKPEGENFYDIRIQFSLDFNHVSQVYVVKNILSAEQKELETSTEESYD